MSLRLVLYPGETDGPDGVTRGHIYCIVDGVVRDVYPACAGPAGPPRNDRGGHTATETPAGKYILGRPEHHTTAGWPMSVIPWGAPLRLRPDGEVEFSRDEGVTWRKATGLDGDVTRAGILFQAKSVGRPLTPDEKNDLVLSYRARVAPGGAPPPTYLLNDFGNWAWNLNDRPGSRSPYFVHTTPTDEACAARGALVSLTNSHGCIHIRPADRDVMMRVCYLAEGVPFEVAAYGLAGPPLGAAG